MMTPASPSLSPETAAPLLRPLARMGLFGSAVALLLALPGAQALWVEDGASHAVLHADVATPDDPLSRPLNLTLEELANLSRPAAEAVQSPGTHVNMTSDEELGLQDLWARMDEGGHDGVQVNGTGYRFALAMPDMMITGGPAGEETSTPTGETAGNQTDPVETGESSGTAIGTLTLISAGAMYWIRRLA